jgi:hypothetical protein
VSATAATRPATARPRVAVSVDAVALAGLAIVTLILAAAAWGTWGDLDSDTGFDILAGARVADGEVPYRDFTYYYGPLAPGLTGLLAWVGLGGLGPTVALGLVVALLIVLATYALARTLVDPLGAFLAAAITAAVAFTPNNYSYVLPHTFAATLGTLLLLAFLLCLSRFAAASGDRWLVAAGVSAGLVTLTKPEASLAALAAGATWLLLRRRAGGRAARDVVRLAGPALLIPAAVYGAFLTAVSPHTLVLENLYPVDELAAGGDTLVRARMPLTVEGIATAGAKFLLYAAGAAILVLFAGAIGRGGRIRTAALATVALGGVLLVAIAAVKPDGLRDGFYYAWGWIPIGALAAVGVALVRFRRRGAAGWSASAQMQLAAGVALAVVAATSFAFTMHGWRPQMSVYYAPLAAILVCRLHLVELARGRIAYRLGVAWVVFLAAGGLFLALREADGERVSVRGPGGTLAETPAEGVAYQRALAEIEAHTRPGEPIFLSPLMTGLYVLAERESPLPVISSMPTALPTAADERAAVDRLQEAGVRLAITDSRPWPGYGHDAFGESFQRRIAAWLERDFERRATLPVTAERSLTVWVRPA